MLMDNAASSVTPLAPGKKLGPLEVVIKGRLEAQRRFKDKYYTRIVVAAPDPYSKPQVCEVRSEGRLGNKLEEVTVTCRIGGFMRKAFKTKDDDGDTVEIVPVEHTLDLVE
jgi:hypothetical protein